MTAMVPVTDGERTVHKARARRSGAGPETGSRVAGSLKSGQGSARPPDLRPDGPRSVRLRR
ncbi:hypothetical protein JCM13580A_40880 [Streptomyces drozdowiczii]